MSTIVYYGIVAVLVALYLWYFYFSDLPKDYRALRIKGWSPVAALSLTIVVVVSIVAIAIFW